MQLATLAMYCSCAQAFCLTLLFQQKKATLLLFIEKASPAGQGITGDLTIHNMSHQPWLKYNYIKTCCKNS